MARVGIWVAILVVVLGVPAAASAGAVHLRFTYSDGAGHQKTAALTCDASGPRATGYLRHRDRAKLCATAYRLKRFLGTPPPRDRVCALIYGGPDRARVRGNVADRAVNRLFTRVNGCEIDDWSRAQALLPRPAGAVAQ
jgi:hypothetical protein